MNVLVIPARGGSKRIPQKNIRAFRGLPAICYSIRAGLEARSVDRVVVSTDDSGIADIALANGADVPFMRPAELADDYTGTIPVIQHAIETLGAESRIESVCCLYATAPLVQAADIDAAFEVHTRHAEGFVVTVTEYASPIQRSMDLTADGCLRMKYPEEFNTRSQDLDRAFHDAGQFYWGRSEVWMQADSLFGKVSRPYVLPRFRVQDLDTEEDWIQAELLAEALANRSVDDS